MTSYSPVSSVSRSPTRSSIGRTLAGADSGFLSGRLVAIFVAVRLSIGQGAVRLKPDDADVQDINIDKRPGNWQKCAACEETLAKALLMVEVYPLMNGKVVRFHHDCYTLWKEERRALES
jgi:hypothetical protein